MKRASTPPLNAWVPRVQLIVSAYEYTGVLSLILAVGFCGTPLRLTAPFGVLPKSARNGIPRMFGNHANASLPVLGLANGPGLFVPVRLIPNRASLSRVGDSVEVKLTVKTCG